MIFDENVSAELQEILSIELHRYKREIGRMTREEWNMLADWVYSGHSPYTNGDDVFDDDGWPLDFINTLRSWDEMKEWYDNLSEEEHKELEEGPRNIPDIPDGNDPDFPEDF